MPPASAPIEVGGPLPAANVAIPFTSIASATTTCVVAAERPPERPVRVLYGVWRN